jgi:glycogen operon protein
LIALDRSGFAAHREAMARMHGLFDPSRLDCAPASSSRKGDRMGAKQLPEATDWLRARGAPYPPGATYLDDEHAINFALFSRHATSVELLLFDDDTKSPLQRVKLDPLRNRTGRVWHVRLPYSEIKPARYYAYSVDGPNDGANVFDPAKVLLDPYARALHVPAGDRRAAACVPGCNASLATLGMLPKPREPFDWGDDVRPWHGHDAVIYELHVGGFTRHPSSLVDERRRGTFLGLIDKIPYLRALGVTIVELMPVQQFEPERGGNYWGYMPLAFFAPHAGYAVTDDPRQRADEFRTLVREFHKAGIEVIVDVVYNHTAEQGEGGPIFSLKGIDNGSYYLMADDLTHYRDETGCGNTLRSAHPAARLLILSSLRYWVEEMHVDGFRFDLASVFSRADDGRVDVRDSPIIDEITAAQPFQGVRLIAEAWDINAYQLGHAFPGRTWHQWNGKFRDDVRAFVKSDPGMVPTLMRRLYGSDDLFTDQLPDVHRPAQSINFITCHDGFCLYDVVSYDRKHNEANGQQNRDGLDANLSWNCGHEGDVDAPPEVRALRKRQVKNFCTLLMLANGTPMISAGDEVMRTQRGNNNAYNQDNELSWFDWRLTRSNADMLCFFQRMIAFRKQHPSIARDGFWRDAVSWYGTRGAVDLSYDSRSLAYFLSGAALQDSDLYVMINAYWEPLSFTIQQPGDWLRVVDTAREGPDDYADPGLVLLEDAYFVAPRSVVVLERPYA